MTTSDSYLHGCGNLENINSPGKIVYVGDTYFVLEDQYHKTAFIVSEESYWVIDENDFTL